MLKWQDFQDLRVIRKIRVIISQWWNTEIFFVDEAGNLKNIDRNNLPALKNTALTLLFKKPAGFDLLNNLGVV